MKIAVILNGQLRTGVNCAPYIKSLFSKYDTDFFIHTWELSNARWLDSERYKNPYYRDTDFSDDIRDTEYYHTDDEFDKIKEIYEPKYFSVGKKDDDYNLAKSLDKEGEVGLMGYYSALKSLFGLSLYKNKTKTEYDLVVRIRPDCIVPQSEIPVFYDTINKAFKDKKLFFCEYEIRGDLSKFPIIDYYQIGSYDNMVKVHKWVYEREFGIDTNLQTTIRDMMDSKVMTTEKGFITTIVRNIMDDVRYIKLLYEQWSRDNKDIWNHMITYMNPVYDREYYDEHVNEPLTKEKIIDNVIKLYNK
jgi:hypothetical protein